MSLEPNANGDFPKTAPTAYVHDTATLIGRVLVKERTFIGPNAVIRADEPGPDGTVEPIVVSDGANVQDNVVIHALGGTAVTIGSASSIAHAAVIHGPCEIGAKCFVGFNSVVFKAVLGDGVVVMHQALVEGVTIPSGLHVPSMSAVRNEEDVCRLARVTQRLTTFADKVYRTNVLLAKAALDRKTGK
jgi:carbonic anhydrase/acetyltransferase-like protein (isoleucine patch superfamily)